MNDASVIAQIIQLAVAPVFLLAGIGAILSTIAMRLGRVVDRARCLEEALLAGSDAVAGQRMREELAVLDRRVVYAQRAISLSSLAALLICLVVAALFIGALAGFNAAAAIAVLFIAAMFCLIGGLAMFLAEVAVATRTLRVRAEIFMKD